LQPLFTGSQLNLNNPNPNSIQMIITIAGLAGSGKSTLAKNLSKALKTRRYSAGDFLRQIAKERGMTLLQLHEVMEKDSSIDREIDLRTAGLARKKRDFIIDGRVAWHFIPESVKVFVRISLRTAAERVFADMREGEKENSSVAQTMRNMRKRNEMNRNRYKKLYGVDYLDGKNYDIIVDTTKMGIGETTRKVIKEIKKIRKKT
jgi:cytidylate kinase